MSIRFKAICQSLFIALLCISNVYAQNSIEVAKVFQSHMVLQRNAPIKIWGTAPVNKSFEVVLDGYIKQVQANKKGRWAVNFPPREASFTPIELRVNQQVFTDILVGDVWLCSGQSNMKFALEKSDYPKSEANCDNPNLRLLLMGAVRNVAKNGYTKEELARCNTEDFFKGTWIKSEPASAKPFSAVGWVMGNKLQKELNIPVGLIQMAIGGSAVNNWLPPNIAKKHPLTKDLYGGDWFSNPNVKPQHISRAKDALQNVLKEDEPFVAGKMPYRWVCEPGFLFEAGPTHLKPLKIKGIAWYQGEADSNTSKAVQDYAILFEQMITSWRKHFGQKDLPFVFVQLPGFNNQFWPQMREVQRMSETKIPNTGMVVTIDTGAKYKIHPKDKTTVGERLAHMALKVAYNKKGYDGFPQLKDVKVREQKIKLTLSNCKHGWQSVEGDIQGFEVMDKEGNYHIATAKMTGKNTIEVCSGVANPKGVRYGWMPFPEPALNLFTREGLPLGPFQSTIKSQNN
ncbi:MAG: sialate O-acetylesterase [Carboxylicivirga sp.]|jgi:sialate O-acetylesterase|nr:sialate O-acetylesterase [Carboxylicivirga sp.]